VSITKVKILLDRESYIASHKELERIENRVLETRYPRLIAQYYSVKAASHLSANDTASAIINAKRTLYYSEQAKFNSPALEAYLVLAEAEEKNQNFELALSYHKQYVTADKAYDDQRQANHLAFQRARFEYELSQRSLEIANTENALLASEAETAKEEAKTGVVLVIFSTSALIVVFIWLYRTNRIKKKFKLLAEIDSLTGISNRHKFYQSAIDAIDFCRKNIQPVSMVIMDLDHFKSINDTYGHTTGDVVLKMVATVLKTECRKNDIVGRLGGEEFGIILPGCSGKKAVEIANDLRKKIAQIDTTESGYTIPVTASFGIAEGTDISVDYDALFRQADNALYRSKNEGRNCVYLAAPAVN
jgi:diguanylate cyclase (GGDEF)-like protein